MKMMVSTPEFQFFSSPVFRYSSQSRISGVTPAGELAGTPKTAPCRPRQAPGLTAPIRHRQQLGVEHLSRHLGQPAGQSAAEFSGFVSCPGPWRQRPARGSKGSKPGEMRASSSKFCAVLFIVAPEFQTVN